MAVENPIIDLLVVGGGTAGIVGAKTAAGFGARTVLVEQARTGGDCLWTGCVPSKTLLSAADHAATARALTGQPPEFAEVRKRIFAAINTIEPVDSPAALEAAGAEVIKGTLTFRAPGVAEVDGRTIRFRQALIATGGAPVSTGIRGLDPGAIVTSDTIWELDTLPGRLAIVGGGPIACELGQAFARLGSEVTLIIRSRILPKEVPDAADLVRDALATDGVRVLENTTVENAVTTDAGSRLRLAHGANVDADVVLLATGRTPRTAGLGLERIGVSLDEAGRVFTDARMMTSNPRIWAAGDVTANPRFTHLAGVHASVAASNAVLGLNRTISGTVPRVTFTAPEVAAVGLTTAEARLQHRARTVRHHHVDRAVTEDTTDGFTRLIVDRRGKILGGTIVGPRAGESLAELTLAVQKGMTTSDIAGTTHPYPTYSDGVWNAAVADVRERLASPGTRRAMAALIWFRRRWLDRPVPHRRDR
ncbi:NAD(P)/FAD-dependent oxidoreductase [Arthrobacter sp. UYEF21]|uniref:dihydrolipoyl dehydrogenase family protein n=1 Tax=Arthrobacter sp. UYEF21 TaxID=1756364 RepID=UPI0033943168